MSETQQGGVAAGAELTSPAVDTDDSLLASIHANDAEEMDERVRRWGSRITQLKEGPFEGHLEMLELGPVFVMRASYSTPVLMQLQTPANCLTMVRKRPGSAMNLVCDHAIQDGECTASGPGVEAEVVTQGILRTSTVSFPMSFWQRDPDWIATELLPQARSVNFLQPGTAWTNGFLSRVDWIIAALDSLPGGERGVNARNGLIDSLVAYVESIPATKKTISDGRDARMRRRTAVKRARSYINEHLADQIRLADLCHHARAQARSLEYGFQESLGMSPIAYIRTMRLHRARKLLRSTDGRVTSISELALDCGFWHLSQFAVDYKALFGESPSTTLRRTLADTCRPEGRRRPEFRGDSNGVRLVSLG